VWKISINVDAHYFLKVHCYNKYVLQYYFFDMHPMACHMVLGQTFQSSVLWKICKFGAHSLAPCIGTQGVCKNFGMQLSWALQVELMHISKCTNQNKMVVNAFGVNLMHKQTMGLTRFTMVKTWKESIFSCSQCVLKLSPMATSKSYFLEGLLGVPKLLGWFQSIWRLGTFSLCF
jgi:hypothetical protein